MKGVKIAVLVFGAAIAYAALLILGVELLGVWGLALSLIPAFVATAWITNR